MSISMNMLIYIVGRLNRLFLINIIWLRFLFEEMNFLFMIDMSVKLILIWKVEMIYGREEGIIILWKICDFFVLKDFMRLIWDLLIW